MSSSHWLVTIRAAASLLRWPVVGGAVAALTVALACAPKPEQAKTSPASTPPATPKAATSTSGAAPSGPDLAATATAEPSAAAAADDSRAAKALVDSKCATCHGLDRFAATRGDQAKWGTIVDGMMRRGLRLSDDEKRQIVGYLATVQGP